MNFTQLISRSERGEVTIVGQRQPNLGATAVNRKDWELSGRVLNQLNIQWAITMFKPY